MRPFVLALCCAAFAACRTSDEIAVAPAPADIVVIDLQEAGYELVFRLPDETWRREADPAFKGFRFREGARSLEVQIRLRREEFAALVERTSASATGPVHAFEPGGGWPFVGVVLAYRGPPDAALVDAFVRSFRIERR